MLLFLVEEAVQVYLVQVMEVVEAQLEDLEFSLLLLVVIHP
jgi:hypothetical protein